ncbi:hypothetical protein [Arthrobacter sp. QXT-31]|uniref:hypothetical protein n=1 Tax=Arthrobacter sp. QXT-31 TaxID=1357915 RepID=UPI00097199AC|nr:hypothetical protein [Arthrobacter sp. QXT-31]APX03949.1 hypothetical protein BWQ92_21490 [Arthrobacter sp. QXT-31]
MKSSNTSAALTIAAVLTLTGCGGSDQTSTTPPPEAASSSTSAASAPAKAYSNEDLNAIVAGLKDAQGNALTVVPAAQIDQGLIAAREMLKTAVITPEACGVLFDNNTQVPEGSTYAAGASLAGKAQTATVMTVFAVKDPSVMTAQFEKSAAALNDCSTYTVELKGKKITNELKPVNVAVQAAKSMGALTIQTTPEGQKQVCNLTVFGVKGNLAVTVMKNGPVGAVTAADAPELAKLVNAALAAG